MVQELINLAWTDNALRCLQVVYNSRDIRGGKGERAASFLAMLWLRVHKPKTYLINLPEFVNMGRYKDLLIITKMAEDASLQKFGKSDYIELEYFAEQLKKDEKILNDSSNDEEKQQNSGISLAAKWAPSPKTEYAKFAKRLQKLLFDGHNKEQQYRQMLSKMRKRLRITETLMCHNDWSEIDYQSTPAKAMKRYGALNVRVFQHEDSGVRVRETREGAFLRHDKERFQGYLDDVASGKTTIKATGIQPHEILGKYRHESVVDLAKEAQLNAIISSVRDLGSLRNVAAVCDVSGSMDGIPMEVSIALGLILCQIADDSSFMSGKLITFSENPELHEVRGENNLERAQSIANMKWGGSTNFFGVFQLLLSEAQKVGAGESSVLKMPEILFIFTDMQFDQADPNHKGASTVYEQSKSLLESVGFKMPKIVFWNLRASSGGFPVTETTEGVALVSGFSTEMLKVFLEGDMDALASFTPRMMMEKVLDKYSKAFVHPDDQ
jgi:hypothetical protein